jgi:uncharacterized membrane protein YdjX (TVP38/TMEM64 family)
LSKIRILPLVVIGLVMLLYLFGDGERFLDPRLYQVYFEESPATVLVLFFLASILCTALSLPVTGVLAVLSGMFFGLVIGAQVALLAFTLGACCGFLVSRYALYDFVQRRFTAQLQVINRGLEEDGFFYLASMRMIVVIPFGILNLLMGMTPIRFSHFFLATFLGMMPAVLILAYVGSRLGGVQSFTVGNIFTPDLVLALTLLATLPLLVRWIRR